MPDNFKEIHSRHCKLMLWKGGVPVSPLIQPLKAGIEGFPGSPVARTLCFYCRGSGGPIPSWEISHATPVWAKKEKKTQIFLNVDLEVICFEKLSQVETILEVVTVHSDI